MPEYNIEITRKFRDDSEGRSRTEIWARITDRETCQSEERRIWWEDDEGVFHDESSLLPVEMRGDVYNAWIEKSRKW